MTKQQQQAVADLEASKRECEALTAKVAEQQSQVDVSKQVSKQLNDVFTAKMT
eukprot:CAMPEP_0198203736 /NCGR_PEP_ID=MMETSP1445-20131203/7074_1 /TAXON_ID=36898 /ORGANISM="Pyramimonas sp., Strain CCMP2087" /LENGTH=52 /DNA_ID=CAMNT_0043875261 /DNA_START=27 /DNA_END=182 /DNA_ORIENTATION=+